MVALVVFADALEHLGGLLDGRLYDGDRLETALQRGILLDVLAVLLEGCRTDHLDLAAGQRGLEDIRGIHGALGITGADEIVYLVDEQDHIARLLHVSDQTLDSALELSAELRAGNECRQVEQIDLLVEQMERCISLNDVLRDALCDCSLADAGLTDQAGIVLRAARQNLHRTGNLAVASDDAVEIAVLRTLGKIRAVVVEILVLGILAALLFLGLGALLGTAFLAACGTVAGAVRAGLGGIAAAEQTAEEIRHCINCAVEDLLRIGIPVRECIETCLVHHVHHFVGHLLQILLADVVAVQILGDLRNIQFLRADKAIAFVALLTALHSGNKDNGGALLAFAA